MNFYFKILLGLDGVPVLEIFSVDGGGFDGGNFLYFGVLFELIDGCGFGFTLEGLCFFESVLILLLVSSH